MIKNTQGSGFESDFKRKKMGIGHLSCFSLTTALIAPALAEDINTSELNTAYNYEAKSAGQLNSSELDCTLSSDSLGHDIKQPCASTIESASNLTQSFLPQLLSGSGISPWVLVGGAGAGLAAATAGGGGGGGGESGESNSSSASYDDIESTDPSAYVTAEYNNRTDLEAINANEAYANITSRVLSSTGLASDTVRASLATGASHGGQGITIAILDTGVDTSHASLSSNISNTCASSACQEYLSTSDPHGHGTHVAGIAAGDRTGQDNSMHGVAYNATILAGCAFIDGGCYEQSVDDGELMLWAAGNGATVANMSYGYTQGLRGKVVTDITGGVKDYTHVDLKDYLFGSYSSFAHHDYQKAKAALEQGLVTAIAAGNTNVSAPENLQPSVMAVAPLIYANTDLHNDLAYQWIAVVNTDNYGSLSDSSHACGDAAAFCLAAPGSSIYSTLPGGEYGRMSGTSMATPQVSGAVALIAGAFPSLALPSGNPYSSVCDAGSSDFNSRQCHSKAVVNRLFVTATDLGEAGVDAIYGNGILNLKRATSLIGTAQLQSASGVAYNLSDSTLTTSHAIASDLSSQLASIHFLATDSYDNAGFIYNAQALLGTEYDPDTRIDTLQYMNRSMRSSSLSSTALSPELTLSFIHTTGTNEQNKGDYRLSYALSDHLSMDVSYGFYEHKDFSTGDDQSLAVGDLSASQAFASPLSHFNENAQSIGFQQVIGNGYLLTAHISQGEITEDFSNNKDALKTTSITLAVNGNLTSRLKARLIAGTLSEDESVLGNHGSGLWDTGEGSQSFMAGINLNYQLNPSLSALFSYYTLSTEAKQSNDFVQYSESLVSDSFSVGLVTMHDSNWQYGVFATQPVRLSSGSATLTLPSYYSERSLRYSDTDIDLAPGGQHMEYEFAMSWKPDSLAVTGKLNLIRVENYGNLVGNNDNIVLLSLGLSF